MDASILKNIDNDSKLYYIIISIIILFIFTTVIKIELGHVLALVVAVSIIILMIDFKKEDIQEFNNEIEFKLMSLLKNGKPEFFHLDADLINLFFSIKQEFASYNTDAYINAIKTADNLLRIRNDMEKILCAPPVPADLKKNFSTNTKQCKKKQDFLDVADYTMKDDTKCSSILLNAFENFQIAEEQVKKCMNYLHSLIISIPSEPVMHRSHEKVMNRAHILLKRNLDIIKQMYDKHTDIHHGTKFITDYDLPKPINKHLGSCNISKSNLSDANFNFY